MKKAIIIMIVAICIFSFLSTWFVQRNKIVGTIRGAEMEKVVIDGVTYILTEDAPYTIKDKGDHIGKGAWPNGEVMFDLYRIEGDKNFDYLFVRFGWEGEIYIREDLKEMSDTNVHLRKRNHRHS